MHAAYTHFRSFLGMGINNKATVLALSKHKPMNAPEKSLSRDFRFNCIFTNYTLPPRPFLKAPNSPTGHTLGIRRGPAHQAPPKFWVKE